MKAFIYQIVSISIVCWFFAISIATSDVKFSDCQIFTAIHFRLAFVFFLISTLLSDQQVLSLGVHRSSKVYGLSIFIFVIVHSNSFKQF